MLSKDDCALVEAWSKVLCQLVDLLDLRLLRNAFTVLILDQVRNK